MHSVIYKNRIKNLGQGMLGKKHSLETKEKMRSARLNNPSGAVGLTGEKNYKWTGGKPKCFDCSTTLRHYTSKKCRSCYLGDGGGYSAVHKWVASKLGTPNTCEHCGKKGSGHLMHWSNKSHQYKRDLNDWQRLCVRCHKNYDLQSFYV